MEKMNVGDKVKLKSGSVPMVIVGMTGDDVTLAWYCEAAMLVKRCENVPVACLVKTDDQAVT